MVRLKRRPLRDYLIAGVLLLVFIWLTYSVVGIVRKEERARHAAREAEEQLEELKERHDTLTENLEDLTTERGKEASYREHFGVARPGEEVIIVVAPPSEVAAEALPWWRKVMGWFGL
jgi:cell division protein FtsB